VTVGDGRRRSATVGDGRRRSATVGDGRRALVEQLLRARALPAAETLPTTMRLLM
jgi:hypothetical protein